MKNAKQHNSKDWSIATRLTLYYSALAAMIMLVFSAFLYWAIVNIFDEADYQFAQDEIIILQKILTEQPNNIENIKQEVVNIPARLGNSVYYYYIRIFDENARIIIETPEFKNITRNLEFPKKYPDENISRSDWQNNKEGTFLLATASADKKYTIQIAVDVSYQQGLIDKFTRYLIIALITAIILSALLSNFLIRRGLLNLQRLTAVAKQISLPELQQRLNISGWPTELKVLGSEFNEMLTRIEEGHTRLSQYAIDLAHELRAPINNMMGEAEIALTRARSVEEYQEVLGSSLEEFQRLAKMIDDLLFLARSENPANTIKRTSINLNKEINDICQFYQVVAEEKNIKFQIVGDAVIDVDKNLFRRVITNLLTNALHYSHFDSDISIHIQHTSSTVNVSVTDHGIGIAAEHLSRVFDRFYRTDAARSQFSGGTGLGLSIVQSIMLLHHGKVEIVSEPRKGTTVTLIFPI